MYTQDFNMNETEFENSCLIRQMEERLLQWSVTCRTRAATGKKILKKSPVHAIE
jgi:hypothetical protein